MSNTTFLRNHADTLAIIAVNLAIAGVLLSMILSNTSRIDSTNARLDAQYAIIIDLIKDGRK